MSGRQRASASAGIGCIDARVSQTVEGHSRGPRSHHCDDDPNKLMPSGQPRCGEHGPAQRKWESENRVLPFDHFQRDAEGVKNTHRKIVRQEWNSLSSQRRGEIKSNAADVSDPTDSVCEKLANTQIEGTDARCPKCNDSPARAETTLRKASAERHDEDVDFSFVQQFQ